MDKPLFSDEELDSLVPKEEPGTMKKSKVEFHAHSYMGIDAEEYGKDYDNTDEEPPGYTIDWEEDPLKFAKALRKGAEFLEKYANNHTITVNID